MRVALALLGACSFATARSPAHPRRCTLDDGAPTFDSVGALVAAGVVAFAPAVPGAAPESKRAVVDIAAIAGGVLAASAAYGFVVIDPDGCRAARVTVTVL
jgi:hypothetical protein